MYLCLDWATGQYAGCFNSSRACVFSEEYATNVLLPRNRAMGFEYVTEDTMSRNMQIVMQTPAIKPDGGAIPFGCPGASGADLLVAAGQEVDSPYSRWIQ